MIPATASAKLTSKFSTPTPIGKVGEYARAPTSELSIRLSTDGQIAMTDIHSRQHTTPYSNLRSKIRLSLLHMAETKAKPSKETGVPAANGPSRLRPNQQQLKQQQRQLQPPTLSLDLIT